MREVEEFWEEVLAQIEVSQVVPVVGPELIMATLDGREVGLYQILAERLLSKYGLHASASADTAREAEAVPLRPYHELNDAVCALAQRGRRVQDLYRPINDLLRPLVETFTPSALAPLRTLASISGFSLFVTTTPDDLLVRAIDQERYDGLAKTTEIVFAPKIGSGARSDLTDSKSGGRPAVCYLFGKVSTSPFVFAIHDEDTLEFVHNLQLNAADGMARVFSALRQKHLLLIGCNFADWLSRFFIRLANTQRLADNRNKREFLIEQSAGGTASLTLFLERFSPDTWIFPGNARDFVVELARRWHERHPRSVAQSEAPSPPESVRPAATESFFISYSRDDLPAARRILAALQDIGADVAWIDKSALHAGDNWKQRIATAINGCHVFLPLLSAHTEAREEGFFREEWVLATERDRRIQGRKFIVPVVVDRDYDGNAGRYRRVPERFMAAHFGHAPEGHPSDELRGELTRLLRERRIGKYV